MQDHQIAQLVNELRDIAIQFHAAQQLRERIAHVIVPPLQRMQHEERLNTIRQRDFEERGEIIRKYREGIELTEVFGVLGIGIGPERGEMRLQFCTDGARDEFAEKLASLVKAKDEKSDLMNRLREMSDKARSLGEALLKEAELDALRKLETVVRAAGLPTMIISGQQTHTALSTALAEVDAARMDAAVPADLGAREHTLGDIVAKKVDEIEASGIQQWTYRPTDAQRYQRLRVLGVAPAESKQLEHGTVLRFQSLDEFVNADFAAHPSRGESLAAASQGAPKEAAPVAWKTLALQYRDCLETIVRNDERNNERDGNTINAALALRLPLPDAAPAGAQQDSKDAQSDAEQRLRALHNHHFSRTKDAQA